MLGHHGEMVQRTITNMTLQLPGTDERFRPSRLRLGCNMHDEIIRHLQASLPNEGCGLLAGDGDAAGAFRATRFFPGDNADRSPTRFTMDGAQVVAAFKEMREHALTLGAIVHSHPASPPEPSPTDIREAFYPDALSVIVSFQDGAITMRAWQWLPENGGLRFRECPIEIIDEE